MTTTNADNEAGQPLGVALTEGLGLAPERAAFEAWRTNHVNHVAGHLPGAWDAWQAGSAWRRETDATPAVAGRVDRRVMPRAWLIVFPDGSESVTKHGENAQVFRALASGCQVIPMYPANIGAPLSDSKIDEIANGMPEGLPGFTKTWGWRQFARAIEAAHSIIEA